MGLEYDDAGIERSYQLADNARGTCTFDARPRDIQPAVERPSYKFGAPVVARY